MFRLQLFSLDPLRDALSHAPSGCILLAKVIA